MPAASWGEKEGAVTNSERRISRNFACALEQRLRPGLPSLFDYDTPESIWNEHRASTQGRELGITGLSYALLDTTWA